MIWVRKRLILKRLKKGLKVKKTERYYRTMVLNCQAQENHHLHFALHWKSCRSIQSHWYHVMLSWGFPSTGNEKSFTPPSATRSLGKQKNRKKANEMQILAFTDNGYYINEVTSTCTFVTHSVSLEVQFFHIYQQYQ